MPDTIFISHANEDKAEIAPIANRLLDEGFNLFIDHPEKIESLDIDLVDGHRVRSLWDIGGRGTDGWNPMLEEELRNCACVLGILSNKISNENGVLLGELVIAKYEKKLILCSISQPTVQLPGDLKGYDAKPLDLQRYGQVIVERSLQILIKRLRMMIDARRSSEGARSVTTSAAEGAQLRDLSYKLALRVGRDAHVASVRSAVVNTRKRKSEGDSTLRPLVVYGPANDGPARIADALNLDQTASGSHDGLAHIESRLVTWPRIESSKFQFKYVLQLAQTFGVEIDRSANDLVAEAEKVIGPRIDGIGHDLVIASTLTVGSGGFDRAEVKVWTDFWSCWRYASQSQAAIIPLLNIEFGQARPGWDNDDVKVPPSIEEERSERLKNEALLSSISTLFPHLQDIRSDGMLVTGPVRPDEFDQWANWIDKFESKVLNNYELTYLTGQFRHEQFGSDTDRESGVPQVHISTAISSWLKNQPTPQG